jgi:hypothetical protein
MSLLNGSEVQAQARMDFHDQWQAFALRRNLALFLLFGWVPVCVGLFLLSRYWLHQPVLFLLIMLVWLVSALATVWWAGQFRCPRCSRRYASLGHKRTINVTRGLFDKICSNCKLTKFEGLS